MYPAGPDDLDALTNARNQILSIVAKWAATA
jgi:hypothetical protein